MVFFVDSKQTGVGYLGVFADADLLFSFKQEKRLEGWRSIHLYPRDGTGNKAAKQELHFRLLSSSAVTLAVKDLIH